MLFLPVYILVPFPFIIIMFDKYLILMYLGNLSVSRDLNYSYILFYKTQNLLLTICSFDVYIGPSSGPRLSADHLHTGEQMCVHSQDQWYRAKTQVLRGSGQ